MKGEIGKLKGYIQIDELDINNISIILKSKKNSKGNHRRLFF